MFDRIFSWRARSIDGGDESGPGCRQAADTIAVSRLRATAAEAGLVTAIDGSLGVLVSLWAHDERLHPHLPHHSPRRRGN